MFILQTPGFRAGDLETEGLSEQPMSMTASSIKNSVKRLIVRGL